MKLFKVSTVETVCFDYIVEAENEDQARQKVNDGNSLECQMSEWVSINEFLLTEELKGE